MTSNVWTTSKPPHSLLISRLKIPSISFNCYLNLLVSGFLIVPTAILWTYSQCPMTFLTSDDLKMILDILSV